MYSQLIIPTFAEGRRDEAMAVIAQATARIDARSKLFAPTLAGVHNGGDAIWRLTFADVGARDAALAGEAWAPAAKLLADPAVTTHQERLGYETSRVGGADGDCGLYRVALFCANVRPDPERLAAFADQTASMPNYIDTIRRWQLSTPAEAEGRRPWTTVWEQEYDDLQGLKGAYMLHPAHWGHVERWFDPEYPEWLVDRTIVHTFCEKSDAVICL
ncbi:Dabb family protein [Sphingomonas crocodyli]|uniref:Dabb family protein n=1 Tax=Sphingomonas crocodyli TaxID=1979270 RepID=A0A437M0I1_9SPHN|nr:Dabb family protein [Sphingomonas crocodyli]RVT91024.1 Dabb family protein [Sphingomonas crocodyli]